MSEAKRAANRANAKKSTGPRTDAGKQKSARNAVRHGFCAKTICVHGEQSEHFNALVAEFVDEHRPVCSTEYALVYRLAVASWNLRRLAEAETALIDANTLTRVIENREWVEKRLDIGQAMLKAMKDDKRFNALQLYQQRLERAFYRALCELRCVRKERESRVDDENESVERSGLRFSERGPDEPTSESAATAEPASPAASLSADVPQPEAIATTPFEQTNPPTHDTRPAPTPVSQTSFEQTNPPQNAQPTQLQRIAARTGPTNEPTPPPRPTPSRPMSEIDMLASNMRRAKQGLPPLYLLNSPVPIQ
jgi:hypothetical protein